MLLNWLLKKLLRRPRERLKKKKDRERPLNSLLIDNLLKMKRQQPPKRPHSPSKHRSRKQLEQLLNKLPKKLQLILHSPSLKLIDKEPRLLRQLPRRLKELLWLLRELLS